MACETCEVHLVPDKLKLPLFLLSRERIKQNNLESMRNYIARQRFNYTKHCENKHATDTKDSRRVSHMVGLDVAPSPPCPIQRSLSINRDLITAKPWQLPPNIYNLPELRKEAHKKTLIKSCPFKTVQRPKFSKGVWKFYDKDRRFEHCNRYKGIFLTNARERKATSRSMVASLSSCYHNPNDPGPAHYNPERYYQKKSFSTNKINRPSNPHRFLPHSSVPERQSTLLPQNLSFLPGPGRFETGYNIGCPCRKGLIFMPGLQMKIDIEKRKKFRRLPHTKIKASKYCSPDWSHVVGRGFRYLFRKHPRMKPHAQYTEPEKGKKGNQREVHMFPDAHYIDMINHPKRELFTIQEIPGVLRSERIEFNTVVTKSVHVRHMKTSKKVAFSSGQDRFKDRAPLTTLTVSQREKMKMHLPVERQLRDQPVTRISIAEIKSKYLEPTSDKQFGTVKKLRKPAFQFLPLPGPKSLSNVYDIRPQTTKYYYSGEIDPKQYLKKNSKKSPITSIVK